MHHFLKVFLRSTEVVVVSVLLAVLVFSIDSGVFLPKPPLPPAPPGPPALPPHPSQPFQDHTIIPTPPPLDEWVLLSLPLLPPVVYSAGCPGHLPSHSRRQRHGGIGWFVWRGMMIICVVAVIAGAAEVSLNTGYWLPVPPAPPAPPAPPNSPPTPPDPPAPPLSHIPFRDHTVILTPPPLDEWVLIALPVFMALTFFEEMVVRCLWPKKKQKKIIVQKPQAEEAPTPSTPQRFAKKAREADKWEEQSIKNSASKNRTPSQKVRTPDAMKSGGSRTASPAKPSNAKATRPKAGAYNA